MSRSIVRPFALTPALLAAACLGACSSTGEALAAQEQRSRTWFEVASAVVERDAGPGVNGAQGPAFFLNGGYDFLTGPQHGGLELGASWARLEAEDTALLGTDPNLDVTTWYLGGRLASHFGSWPVGVYARAGGLWRQEDDRGGADLADDGAGYYLGAGLDWWYFSGAALSLFVLYSSGDVPESTAVGLSARFFLAPDSADFSSPGFTPSGPAWR